MLPTADIERELKELQGRGLNRSLCFRSAIGGKFESDGRLFLNFGSNDYLNLASSARLKAAAAEAVTRIGAGATASRLIAGSLDIHLELESRLAGFKGYPAALLFGSGALANLGAIPVLAGKGDEIFADRLVHATVIDGIRLSQAKLTRFKHNDPSDLLALLKRSAESGSVRRRFIITESVFSMDGDLAPLIELADLAEKFGAGLIVDEAHAVGIFGQAGEGLVGARGLNGKVDLIIGTLSKALGGYGGFVCSSEAVCRLLVNRARTFIYSTALPPGAAASALAALDLIPALPREELLSNADYFRSRLIEQGLELVPSQSQIVPVLAPGNRRANAIAERLLADGVIVSAIREPTVPRGSERLRFSITLAHTRDDLARAAGLVGAAFRSEGEA